MTSHDIALAIADKIDLIAPECDTQTILEALMIVAVAEGCRGFGCDEDRMVEHLAGVLREQVPGCSGRGN